MNLPNLGEIPKSRRLYKILVLYVVIAAATIVGLQFFDFVPPVSFLVAAATVLSFDLASDAIARNKKRV